MQSITNRFDKLFLFFSYCIIFGISLAFSTATRSVFEVNKLGIFKISIIFMGLIFAYDRLLGDRSWFYDFKKIDGLTYLLSQLG